MTESETRKSKGQFEGFDWPFLTFFALAYLIAWILVPVLNSIAVDSGLSSGDLLEAIENGHWAYVSGQLTVPAWLLFILTRIQDFAFTISALIVAFAFEGRSGLGRLGEKMLPGRASWRWYALALLLPLTLFAATALIAIAGDPTISDTLEISVQTLLAVLFSPGAGILFYLFLRAGLGEEPGLRGYALSRSQNRRSPLLSSLVIGILWAGWHGPALIDQDGVTIVFFSLFTIALSFLFTWIFNKANKAIWVVALLHATINAGDAAFETIFPGLEGTDWQLPALLAFIVVSLAAAVAIWRGQRKE